MRLKKLTEVMQIKGVRVYAHWSVLLIHESGHMLAAQWKGYEVSATELYPIHGLVRYQQPWSRYDDAVIAWRGVAAQTAIGVPLVVCVAIFGFTRFNVVNVVVGIFGYFSLLVGVLNLIPLRPLDGAKAWYLIPELIKRADPTGKTKAHGRMARMVSILLSAGL